MTREGGTTSTLLCSMFSHSSLKVAPTIVSGIASICRDHELSIRATRNLPFEFCDAPKLNLITGTLFVRRASGQRPQLTNTPDAMHTIATPRPYHVCGYLSPAETKQHLMSFGSVHWSSKVQGVTKIWWVCVNARKGFIPYPTVKIVTKLHQIPSGISAKKLSVV